jgi:hypothetical protein
MENHKGFKQIDFMVWMRANHGAVNLSDTELIFIGIYFENRLRGESFLLHDREKTSGGLAISLLEEFMREKGIMKELTSREKFAEHISSLRKINQTRHCSVCNDSLFLGFKTFKDGSEELLKCSCATYGETEYTRLFGALIEMEKNLYGSVLSARERNEKWMVGTAGLLSENFKIVDHNFQNIGDGLDKIMKHTFWGAIRFGIFKLITVIVEPINKLREVQNKKREV